MQTNITRIFESKNFEKMYKKTILPNCFYLKLKSPLAAQFELTGGCNQKCIFCYNIWKEGCSVKKEGKNLSKKEQLKVIDKLIDNEVFDIIFSGGEPLLTPWLEELIKKCSDAKMNTAIITNGAMLTKERAIRLKDSGLMDIQISVHHYGSKINDEITGVKMSLEKSLEGIKNALEIFGAERINVNMVVLPKTYLDVYRMAGFLKEKGVVSFSAATPSVTGELKSRKDLVINKEMFLNVFNQLIKANKDFGIHVGVSGGFPICLIPKVNQETLKMVGNYCDAGLNQLVIGPDGDLRPCVCFGEKLGNILKVDLKEVWANNPFLLNLREMKFVPETCRECKYVSICRGGCRASAQGYFNKLNAIDPLMQ